MRTFDKITSAIRYAVSDILSLNAASGEVLQGTDHSHYDWETPNGDYVPVDYDAAYETGSRFAILKVVNGAIIQNFAEQELARARASKVRAIPYMWPYPVKYISAASQAQKYYQVMSKYPGVVIALDAEETPNYPNPQGSDHEAVIREYWKLVPGQKFLLYSRLDYILSNGFNTPFFAQFPLWLSRPGAYEPIVPSEWAKLGKTWAVWQDDWKLPPLPYGVTNGKTSVDGNKIRASDFVEIFGTEPTEPPIEPPIGETMYGKVIVKSLFIRNAPNSTTGVPVGALVLNDIVEADTKINGWWHLTKINNNGVPNNWYAYEGTSNGYIQPIAEPPVVDSITIDIAAHDVKVAGDLYEASGVKLNKA